MKKLFKIILIFLIAYVPENTHAFPYDFTVDGIYYRKSGTNVIVTSQGTVQYVGAVNIPPTVYYEGINYTVTEIDEYAFDVCRLLTSVVIPNTVTKIGNRAFYSCSSLRSIEIPRSVTKIESGAFDGCSSLTTLIFNAENCDDFYYYGGMSHPEQVFSACPIDSVIIGNSVKRIPSYLLYGTKSTSISLTLGDSVQAIGDYAFTKSIDTLTIPKSVTNIGKKAFGNVVNLIWNAIDCNSINESYHDYDCNENLQSVIIGDCVRVIPSYFVANSKVKSVIIPESVTTISDYSFYNCKDLETITIPNTINEIEYSAFSGCSKLKNLSIPGSVTNIGANAFYECYNLTEIDIPDGVSIIEYGVFSGCTGLESITLPNSITSIYGGAFYGCRSLKGIDIPSNVTYIGKSAFQGCEALTNLFIPGKVNEIGEYAFYECNGLDHVTIQKSTPPTGSNYMFPSNKKIYVPDASRYRSNSTWNRYNLNDIYTKNVQMTTVDFISTDLYKINNVVIKDSNNETIDSLFAFNDKITINGLQPGTYYKTRIYVSQGENIFEIDDFFTTTSLVLSETSLNLSTQVSLLLSFSINRDEGLELDAYGFEGNSNVYSGVITELTNEQYTIECTITGLTPNCSYSFRPWVQYNGEKYYGKNCTFKTASIDVNYDAAVTPTSIFVSSNYPTTGDAEVNRCYFTFNDEQFDVLYKTGLNPNTSYSYTYTIETTTGDQITNKSIKTSSLTMNAQPVKMLTNTTVMLEAQTNMIDDETMVGFEWRRYDAPSEMPSTQVYSPVFGGKIAGTLKNLAENVYYKYRPFYRSNSNKYYYGNWVAFLTADANVEYEPMVYTYNSPVVGQTEAVLQGVALRGSDEIIEQGFEYWKSGVSSTTKIIASGERMSKKITGLQSGTRYSFRAFVTTGSQTIYGNEVEFVTKANSFDVNLDGEINIADINAVIDIILTDSSGISGDVNGDGEVNIADINAIIDTILSI